MNFDNIPAEIQAWIHCNVWRLMPGAAPQDKPRKVPYNPNTGYPGKPNQASSYGPFAIARKAYAVGGYTGLGIGLLPEDPPGALGALDIDNCIGPDGAIDERALDILSIMQSYAEITPSNTGLRVFFTAPGAAFDFDSVYSCKPGAKHPSHGVECYIAGNTRAGRSVPR